MKGFSAPCYNATVIGRWYALTISVLLSVFGCALTDDTPSTSQITFGQVIAAPESFKEQPVTFGGKILGARRLKDGTRIEVLQLPLTSSLKPSFDLSKSQGRFVAMQNEFLDPATIPSGTFVTVTGEIAGSVTMPFDETEYTYPIVEIKNLLVWPKDDAACPQVCPYPYGPDPYWGPYWGPYWSPYWRPWPYW